jgi:hypothetical protein
METIRTLLRVHSAGHKNGTLSFLTKLIVAKLFTIFPAFIEKRRLPAVFRKASQWTLS